MTSIKPGSYTFLVHDLATDHDFHLTGPGIDKTTSVGSTGQSVWHLSLKKGTYRYVCDPHSSYMKGSLTVA